MAEAPFGMVISGDPRRQALAMNLFSIYRTYPYLEKVILLYRKNPAIAFNDGVAHLAREKTFIGCGGDVYIGEKELLRFVQTKGDVVHEFRMMEHRPKATKAYPRPWHIQQWPFTSGLFCMPVRLAQEIPFPEEPSFAEDVLWEKAASKMDLNIVAVQAPVVHIDYHGYFLPRFRVIQWAMSRKINRFGMIRTLAWNARNLVESMHDPGKPLDMFHQNGMTKPHEEMQRPWWAER